MKGNTKMKFTTLGTNGWFDNENGATMCSLIQTGKINIILDAGFGIRKIKGIMDFSLPTVILLTHLHLDHTVGLHTLDFYHFDLPVKFVVPAGMKDAFLTLCASPYTNDIHRSLPNGFELYDTNELDRAGLPFKVSALPLCHPVPDFGYRLEIEGKTIAYLCDTGYCANAVELARNADLVLSECGELPGRVKENWPHMEPNVCAKLALEANVKQMVLTHFGAGVYSTMDIRKNSVESARSVFPNLIAAVDNMEIVL